MRSKRKLTKDELAIQFTKLSNSVKANADTIATKANEEGNVNTSNIGQYDPSPNPKTLSIKLVYHSENRVDQTAIGAGIAFVEDTDELFITNFLRVYDRWDDKAPAKLNIMVQPESLYGDTSYKWISCEYAIVKEPSTNYNCLIIKIPYGFILIKVDPSSTSTPLYTTYNYSFRFNLEIDGAALHYITLAAYAFGELRLRAQSKSVTELATNPLISNLIIVKNGVSQNSVDVNEFTGSDLVVLQSNNGCHLKFSVEATEGIGNVTISTFGASYSDTPGNNKLDAFYFSISSDVALNS